MKWGQQQSGMWLRRYGLMRLVEIMAGFSAEYGMGWADKWDDHLDDPVWMKKAMAHTFAKLSDDDKKKVQEDHDLWQWYFDFCDVRELVKCEYFARCYILDHNGRRVSWAGEYKTICVSLVGETQCDAILQLNTDAYEFISWM